MTASRRSDYEVLEAPSVQIIDCGKEEKALKCTGFQRRWLQSFILHALSIFFLGVPYLFLRWYPQFHAYLGYQMCSLDIADRVLIQVPWGSDTLQKVVVTPGSEAHIVGSSMRYFIHQYRKFVWSSELRGFKVLQGLVNDKNTLVNLVENFSSGISLETQKQLLAVYGKNEIDVKIKSYWKLLIDEILNPFYVFEILSVIFWLYDTYIFYSIFIIIISIYTIIHTLIQTRKVYEMTRDMLATGNNETVSVRLSGGETVNMPSRDLVPGDIIVIPPNGCLVTCDSLLLHGKCIVNESVLTGESDPVVKSSVAYVEEVYDPHAIHSCHTLYRGTKVLQSRFYDNNQVTALVVRTGSDTANGQLVRSILCPKNYSFNLYADSIKFLLLMFLIAFIGTCVSIYLYIYHGAETEDIILRSLDIITIVVPPALPAAMTIGNNYSLKRLKKLNIFSTSVSSISIWGKVKLICFDKTGTLTEEGLDVFGVLPNGQTSLDPTIVIKDLTSLDTMSPLAQTMGCCQTLTYIEGKLCGDPLDLSMFNTLNWVLEDPGVDANKFDLLAPTIVKPKLAASNTIEIIDELVEKTVGVDDFKVPYEIGIVKQFPFSTSTMTMTVIGRVLGANHMTVYTKGAPESIINMCNPDTVPANIEESLSEYTKSGYRVIALAYKPLPRKCTWHQVNRFQRHEVENNLAYLGLLLMQNSLKPKSSMVISELQKAIIKCVMVTGDNLLTAVSVSQECGIIPGGNSLALVVVSLSTTEPTIILKPLSLTSDCMDAQWPSSTCLIIDGTNWALLRTYLPKMVYIVASRCLVFARMSPNQKSQLIEVLQSIDYTVAMVGDGANDCGALKAADVSVSLSQTEASIVAPFTSSRTDVTCVLDLMKEGRCALVTSFGIFKYMTIYSFLQFHSVILLYSRAVELSNMEFLFVDLIVTTSLAFMMGRAGPAKHLVAQKPVMSLVAHSVIIPLMLHLITCVVIQYLSLLYLDYQPWFVRVNPSNENGGAVQSWENTAVYITSCFQFFIQAWVFCKGKPHRQPFHTNWVFTALVMMLSGFTCLILIFPPQFLAEFFELMPWTPNESQFRVSLLAIAVVNTLFALIIENVVAESRMLKFIICKITNKKELKNKYKQVEKEDLVGCPFVINEDV